MKTFNGRLRFRGNQVHVQLNALGLAGPALQNLLAEYLVSGERGTVTFRLTRALITNDGSLVISGYVANANTVQACHQ